MEKSKNKISLLAGAATTATTPTVTTIPYSSQTIQSIVGNAIDIILNFAGALAVLFIIYAGVLYITSSGSKDRIDTAKKTLTYAVLGIIVIVLSKFIVAFVNGNLPNLF